MQDVHFSSLPTYILIPVAKTCRPLEMYGVCFRISGSSILKDGHTSLEEYGQDLDQLGEGDRIGVIRTSSGALHFYVNGQDQGQAIQNIPEQVWAVVDMYGKCAQVTITDDVNRETSEYIREVNREASEYSRDAYRERVSTRATSTEKRVSRDFSFIF